MSVPRVLLLEAGTGMGQNAGEIFLRQLCHYYPKDALCRLAVTHGKDDAPGEDWIGFPIAYVRHPRERGLGVLGRFSWLTTLPLHWYIRNIRVPALTASAVQFARRHSVELVWAFLNSPTLIYMAPRVAAALGVPLVATIWDPPERFAVDQRLDPVSRRMLLRRFADALRMAVRCGVASEGMQEEYRSRYNVDSVVLIHGVHPGLRRPPATHLSREGQFIIGIAGSLYADREFQALLSALSSVGWRLDGRDVTVRVLGADLRLRAQGRMRVEYLGWRPLDETIDLMSQTDVGYLPYWFDKRYDLAVRLCFPNKMTTYLAAGRPVLFHGPEDSSPAHFLRRFPAGLCCHSLDQSEIIESLRRFAADPEFYASAAQAGQRALDEELDLQVFLRRFAMLVGIEEGELLPAMDTMPLTFP